MAQKGGDSVRVTVNFDTTGYVEVARIPADRMPWLNITGKSAPAGPPMITLYACIKCGALVPQIAEAGRLTHNSFHQDLELMEWDGK